MVELYVIGDVHGLWDDVDAAFLEARGKRAAMLGGILNVIAIALIALMVWKPGGPRI